MNRLAAGWAAAAIVSISISACGSGKPEAAMVLDEARLGIATARKAEGQSVSSPRLADALMALVAAEASFEMNRYPEAKTFARRAVDRATEATKEAKSRTELAKPASSNPSTVKKKKQIKSPR